MKKVCQPPAGRVYRVCPAQAGSSPVVRGGPGTSRATTMLLTGSPSLRLPQKMFLQYREARIVRLMHLCAWAKWIYREHRLKDRGVQNQISRVHRDLRPLLCLSMKLQFVEVSKLPVGSTHPAR